MGKSSYTVVRQIDGSLLYISELLHRVCNEYASTISFASSIAAKSSSVETKNALREMINYLHALAETHHILRPPLTDESIDLSKSIARLCRAMASAGLEKRGITFHLALAESIILDKRRCWHTSLIIAELITNAARHASFSQAGRVWVSVESVAERIICRVSDNGSSRTVFNPGLGSLLVNALAKEIHGRIERQFGASGAMITLSFPRETRSLADRIDFLPPAQARHELR
jgi:two-component sensor histidine kinase